LKISRPNQQVLVVAEHRLSALLGVLVCLGIPGIFYFTFPGFSEFDLNALFLLLPIFLAPYLVKSIRTLTLGETLRFDKNLRVVKKNGIEVAAFGSVKNLQLRAVDGTCEQLLLSALLADGTRVRLHTGDSVASTVVLADEISEFLGVATVWTT
jgi:hypothetical protein